VQFVIVTFPLRFIAGVEPYGVTSEPPILLLVITRELPVRPPVIILLTIFESTALRPELI